MSKIFLNINPKLSIEKLVKKVSKGGNVTIISGSRGSGKTATSWYLVEKMHQDLDKKIYVIGVPVSLSKHLPKYVNIVSKIEDVPNDCVVFIDEAGIQFASRMWRKDNHAYLSDVFHIARHKNISLIFVSLSSALVDVNIIRLADTLIFKRPSLLQFKLERRQIRNLYEKVLISFKKTKVPLKLTYIFDSDFEGTVELPLPSFWCEEISKSYKYFTIGKGLEGMSEIEEGTMGYIDSITYHCSCHGDVGLCVRNGGDYYNHEFSANKPMLKRINDKFHIVGRVRVTSSGIEDYDGEENNFRVVDLPKEIKKIGILKEITVKGEPLVVSSAVLATDKDGKWLFILEEGERSVEKNPKFVILKKSFRNQTFGVKPPYLIELKECDALEHEIGHAVIMELTFGKTFKDSRKKPHFKKACEYAIRTYLVPEGIERADEGWAQSFADFIQRPGFLKKESPSLYEYWKDVFLKNPEIKNIISSLTNEAEKINICRGG
jgi:hypothetical protein